MNSATRSVCLVVCLVVVSTAPSSFADPLAVRLELVAPGRAGGTDQAQPTMDAFAAAVAGATGRPPSAFSGHYTNDLETGLERLRADPRALTFVPFEYYLRYGDELHLEPILAIADANGVEQPWHLIAGTGTLDGPGALADRTLAGLAGYTPRVMRRVLLADWGELPESVTIRPARRILGELRAAAADGSVAVLLDTAQHAALARLPFAADLELVTSTRAWPMNLVCVVGERIAADELELIRSALLGLHEREDGAAALREMRQERFVPIERVDASMQLGRRRMMGHSAERSDSR